MELCIYDIRKKTSSLLVYKPSDLVYSLLFKVRIKEGIMGVSWHTLLVTGCAVIGESSG